MRYRSHGPSMKITRDEDLHQNKRLIATFPGQQYVAEREDGELRIYLVGEADDLARIAATTDRSISMPSRLAALNRRNADFYGAK